MKYFSSNIEFLRTSNNLKQSQLTDLLGVDRTTWSNYERGKSFPKLELFHEIAKYFGVNEGDLLNTDLSNVSNNKNFDIEKQSGNVSNDVSNDVSNRAIKGAKEGAITKNILENITAPIVKMPAVVTVDEGGNDNIVHVPVKARAGYLLGYGDTQYISQLPSYKIPGLRNGTYRSFETEGVSMAPTLYPGDITIGQWEENFDNIRDGRVYIVVTKTLGVVVKRLLNRIKERGKIYLKSDTIEYKDQYPTIELDPSEITELWYARLRITPQFLSDNSTYRRINDLEIDMIELKEEIQAIRRLKSN